MENLASVITGHEALVILDQDDTVVKDALAIVTANAMKCIYNQCVTAFSPQFRNPQTYFLHKDEINDLEEAIIVKLENWSQSHAYTAPIAEDEQSKKMLEIARRIAPTQATVLICGETGTGKEILAKYIHQHSAYVKGPFISVNCAAVPENMMEAILFGYEKGAFTGAVNAYVGKFEQAQNGTLMLDEISEMPLELQAKLLRVLQERELERLGGKKIIKLNNRIIAATNRDLKQQVAKGLFRSDLYYRLNVLPITCLTLKERADDILPLANHFLEHYASAFNKMLPTLTDEAQEKLMQYSWSGNIRELENVMQRALVMSEDDIIDADDIALDIDEDSIVVTYGRSDVTDEKHDATITHIEAFRTKLAENEAKIIIDVLNESGGYRHIAAKKLNISPRTLRYKLAKLKAIGLKVPK